MLKQRLHRALASDPPLPSAIEQCMAEARSVQVELDTPASAFDWTASLRRVIDRLARDPDDLAHLERSVTLAELAVRLHVDLDLWHAENECWALLQRVYPSWRAQAAAGDAVALRRVTAFARLCAAINVSIDAAPLG